MTGVYGNHIFKEHCSSTDWEFGDIFGQNLVLFLILHVQIATSTSNKGLVAGKGQEQCLIINQLLETILLPEIEGSLPITRGTGG